MAPRKPVKRTTPTPERMLRRSRRPTPMGATEARSSPRTATRHTPSIKPRRKGQWARYRLRRVAKVSPHRARMAIMLLRDKPPVEPSMRRQTAMSTRTRGVVGIKPKARAITPQATRGPTLLPLVAMEGRRAADHRPSAEAVGNRGRRVVGVRQAAEATEVAGEANGHSFGEWNVAQPPQNGACDPATCSGVSCPVCRLQQIREPRETFDQRVRLPGRSGQRTAGSSQVRRSECGTGTLRPGFEAGYLLRRRRSGQECGRSICKGIRGDAPLAQLARWRPDPAGRAGQFPFPHSAQEEWRWEVVLRFGGRKG